MEEVEWKDEEMGEDLENFPTSWSLQGTTRLNQNFYLLYLHKCQSKNQSTI